MNALLRYYFDTTLSNLGFSLLISVYAGLLWGMISFGTFGTLLGYLVFSYFKNNEYYFYYNLGYTKRALIIRVWVINVLVALSLLGLLSLIFSLL